jgi:hypothetical protein
MRHPVRTFRPARLWCHGCRAHLERKDAVHRRPHGRSRSVPWCRDCARARGLVP